MSENPPAFPVPNDGNVNGQEGMTLRDWFAGQALAGLLAYPDGGDPGQTIEQHTAHHAEIAYRYADAMLAERAKASS